jgi:8-oxo-dGTP pyrophosphatase MutT (NUDIX family)
VLADILKKYLEQFPEEQAGLSLLKAQVKDQEALNDRRNFRGHITAGGIVLSKHHDKVLLIHHKIFNKWFQPAGHWDASDSDPLAAARREVTEETKVSIGTYLPVLPASPLVPLDIDTHPIPSNPAKSEAAHFHHDFRYVFIAENMELEYQAAEVYAAKWFDLKDPAVTHVKRCLGKLTRLNLI